MLLIPHPLNNIKPYLFYDIDENCHLVFCPPGNTKTLEGCAGSENVYSYEDQLTRDYPSFSQVRKAINEKSKLRFIKIQSLDKWG